MPTKAGQLESACFHASSHSFVPNIDLKNISDVFISIVIIYKLYINTQQLFLWGRGLYIHSLKQI